MEEKLFIYYTSDLHSHFENWPKIITYLNEKKAERTRNNQSYIIADNGDHVDRFHPITEASMGARNIELLNQAGYHVATIGNNEGITLDYNDLFKLYDEAGFDLVCANLESIDGNNPNWLKTTTHIQMANGITIGVIGLTAPFNAYYNLLGWNVKLPMDVLDQQIKLLADQTDIIVLLSHLGISDDEQIAKRFPDIDVIIGGHTHHLFRHGEEIENTLLTAAGKHGKYVGEVILTWDHDKQKLVNKEAYTTSVDHLKTSTEMEQQLQTYSEHANQKLNQTVVTIEDALESDWYGDTPLMRMLVDSLKDWTTADCAMLNAGVILDKLDSGAVSFGDIHRICPHPINPCLVELTGRELVEVIRQTYAKNFIEFPLKGFGFRGKIIGKMVFAGLEAETFKAADGEEKIRKVLFNNEEIEPDKMYKLATADTFTFGKLLPEIARSGGKKFFMPEFLRDLLATTLRKNYQD